MKISDHYHVEELVHPEIIDRYGIGKVAKYVPIYVPWLIATQEAIRKWAGCPTTVNNYLWDDDYKAGGWDAIKGRSDLYIDSGIRNLAEPYGSGFSAHYSWNCTDSKFADYDTAQMQQDIIRNPAAFPYVVRMEDTHDTRSASGEKGRDWLHTQSGVLMPGKKIEVFRP